MLLKQVFSFCKEACGLYTGPCVKNLEMPTRERERGPELFPPAALPALWRLLFLFLSFIFFFLLALFYPSHCIFEEYFLLPIFTYIAKSIKVLFNTFFGYLDFLIQLLMPQGHCDSKRQDTHVCNTEVL